jgi:hypothetical protein
MKKKYGTLAALSALTASLVVAPTGADAGGIGELSTDIDDLREQCDYIWENRTNFELLTAELNRIVNYDPNVQTCTQPMSPEMRRACEEQCTALILALLGEDPVAQIDDDVDGY